MTSTKDHDKIRTWAKDHDGHPAVVEGTGGLLRIDFGAPNEKLQRIDWDEFFKIFDDRGLELVYSENPKNRFHKFVYPENVKPRSESDA